MKKNQPTIPANQPTIPANQPTIPDVAFLAVVSQTQHRLQTGLSIPEARVRRAFAPILLLVVSLVNPGH